LPQPHPLKLRLLLQPLPQWLLRQQHKSLPAFRRLFLQLLCKSPKASLLRCQHNPLLWPPQSWQQFPRRMLLQLLQLHPRVRSNRLRMRISH
jgi:hypothetical protein